MALQELAPTPAGIVVTPSAESIRESQLTAFMHYVESQTDLRFGEYRAFEEWAARDYQAFWRLFLLWSELSVAGSFEPVCTSDDVETSRFFPGLRLSYAENLLTA